MSKEPRVTWPTGPRAWTQLAEALKSAGITPPPYDVNTGHVLARYLLDRCIEQGEAAELGLDGLLDSMAKGGLDPLVLIVPLPQQLTPWHKAAIAQAAVEAVGMVLDRAAQITGEATSVNGENSEGEEPPPNTPRASWGAPDRPVH